MSHQRQEPLQRFLDLTERAIRARTRAESAAGKAMARVSAALATVPPPSRQHPPATRPACDHLPNAIAAARRGPADIAAVADAIAALAPQIAWQQRSGGDAAFAEGHANADILGPAANSIEVRHDLRVGISLMAPGITYPDHQHPPEEVYIVLSGGDWRQEARPWHTPGLGGIVYNPPNIVHAMCSGAEPLLAIWCLPLD